MKSFHCCLLGDDPVFSIYLSVKMPGYKCPFRFLKFDDLFIIFSDIAHRIAYDQVKVRKIKFLQQKDVSSLKI